MQAMWRAYLAPSQPSLRQSRLHPRFGLASMHPDTPLTPRCARRSLTHHCIPKYIRAVYTPDAAISFSLFCIRPHHPPLTPPAISALPALVNSNPASATVRTTCQAASATT
jgi:hypothetical protein